MTSPEIGSKVDLRLQAFSVSARFCITDQTASSSYQQTRRTSYLEASQEELLVVPRVT